MRLSWPGSEFGCVWYHNRQRQWRTLHLRWTLLIPKYLYHKITIHTAARLVCITFTYKFIAIHHHILVSKINYNKFTITAGRYLLALALNLIVQIRMLWHFAVMTNITLIKKKTKICQVQHSWHTLHDTIAAKFSVLGSTNS